jgi:hypothetical protein
MTLKLPKRLQEKTPSHARSKKQEKQLAERIGGRTTPGSGSGQYQHGDVKLRKITTIECKTTKHKSFSVTTDLLDKLDAAVFGSGEIPMFEIELENRVKGSWTLPPKLIDQLSCAVCPSPSH